MSGNPGLGVYFLSNGKKTNLKIAFVSYWAVHDPRKAQQGPGENANPTNKWTSISYMLFLIVNFLYIEYKQKVFCISDSLLQVTASC